MHAASRTTRRLAGGAFTIFALACGGDSITATSAVAGTYSLQTVNGAALPVTLTDTVNGVQAQYTFLAPSSFLLGTDKSVRIVTTVRFVYGTIDEVESDTSVGTYALNGQQLTFSQPGSTSFTGTWNGSNMLTIADEGGVFVFVK
jgi:hypothetical protein